MNALEPARFTVRDRAALRRAVTAELSAPARAAVEGALAQRARQEREHALVERLQDGIGQAVVRLPFVFAPALGRQDLEQLADTLEDQLL
jgi:anti-sigma factor RsiW